MLLAEPIVTLAALKVFFFQHVDNVMNGRCKLNVFILLTKIKMLKYAQFYSNQNTKWAPLDFSATLGYILLRDAQNKLG